MRITIDTNSQTISHERDGEVQRLPLYSNEGFALLSQLWLTVGWNQKYTYTFSWMGRPIIQLPDDMIRVQEVIYRLKPDVIIETGVAHGGSLIFYASLCKAIGKGRVIGIDIEIRPHNRKAIEEHELFPFITLIEGSSIDPTVVAEVHRLVQPNETALILLDSRHTRDHVLAELEAYHDLVSPGSYIVATDGIMRDLDRAPRGQADWGWNNPAEAALQFAQQHPEFEIEQPSWPFNESELRENVTHWPHAWLRRRA